MLLAGGFYGSAALGHRGAYALSVDVGAFGPLRDGMAGQLGAVVRDNHLWLAPIADDAIRLAGNAYSRMREVIDDTQRAELATVRQDITDDVQAPTLVGPIRQEDRLTCANYFENAGYASI